MKTTTTTTKHQPRKTKHNLQPLLLLHKPTFSIIGKGATDHDGLEIQCSPQTSYSVLTIHKDTGKIISNTGEVWVNGIIYACPVTTSEIKKGTARQAKIVPHPVDNDNDSGYITSPEREDSSTLLLYEKSVASSNILPLLVPLINKHQKKKKKNPPKKRGKLTIQPVEPPLPSFLSQHYNPPLPPPPPPKSRTIQPAVPPVPLKQQAPPPPLLSTTALGPIKKRKRDKTETDGGKKTRRVKKQKLTTTTTPAIIPVTILPPLQKSPHKLKKAELKHFTQTKELCIFCMAARKECTNLPCNHTMACLQCTYAFYKDKSVHMKCFMCNKEVIKVV